MLTPYTYLAIGVGTVGWALPFPLCRSKRRETVRVTLDPRARWGVGLQGVAYTLLWQGKFWLRTTSGLQIGIALSLFAAACLLSWSSAITLGKEFRVDAVLTDSHRLLRSGPYGVVRHPIYASMLCLLLATGILIAQWYLLVAAVVVFLLGTEIRTRTEERLLESRFGEEFRSYRQTVKGLVPFLR